MNQIIPLQTDDLVWLSIFPQRAEFCQRQFLKLEGTIVTLEQTVYELDPLDRVASILTAMVA
ncbi:MAG: hypothetical protein HY785_17350 [Oscillatoriophycideae cyanobacterium NC_groundwater_1537_Pr4_S-0.65um_50_18]|nr:hypothetical protein [Oscillatoriophycideae cyanobacterium NC_groundwater_1537_Pr4_S-0.65um_50_18]